MDWIILVNAVLGAVFVTWLLWTWEDEDRDDREVRTARRKG